MRPSCPDTAQPSYFTHSGASRRPAWGGAAPRSTCPSMCPLPTAVGGVRALLPPPSPLRGSAGYMASGTPCSEGVCFTSQNVTEQRHREVTEQSPPAPLTASHPNTAVPCPKPHHGGWKRNHPRSPFPATPVPTLAVPSQANSAHHRPSVLLSAWDPVCDCTLGPPHAKPLRAPGSCTYLSCVPPHNLLQTTVNSRLGRSHSCSPSPGGGAWAALVHKEVTAAATVFRPHDSPGCLGWDMAREADPMPTTSAAQRDSVQGQGARRQTEGERTVVLASLTAWTGSLRSLAVPGQLQA